MKGSVLIDALCGGAGGGGATVMPNDRTAVTTDGSWTAQFEHTLLITDTGVDILTAYE